MDTKDFHPIDTDPGHFVITLLLAILVLIALPGTLFGIAV